MHVAAVVMLDSGTSSGGRLAVDDLQRLVASRLSRLPRAAGVGPRALRAGCKVTSPATRLAASQANRMTARARSAKPAAGRGDRGRIRVRASTWIAIRGHVTEPFGPMVTSPTRPATLGVERARRQP
jgi:hypothetical protein